MAAKKQTNQQRKSNKTIHKEFVSRHLLQINFKLTKHVGWGERETVGVVSGDRKIHNSFKSGRNRVFFCICIKYLKLGSLSERLWREVLLTS